MRRISVECDKFSVSANPDHFAAIYNVVTDLLLYSDPLQKSRSKKLEAIVFTHDFSNLSGATEIVMDLQQRIRALGDLAQQYQVHLDELDDDGRYELFVARAEFTRLSNELNLVVLAITRAQDFNGVAKTVSKTAGIQFEARASELVWHMLDKSDTPFTKFSVKGVEFSWISKQDSSISNRLVIKDLKALNSSPEQIFAEIIAKHEHVPDHELCKVDVFAAILWNALAPVGGISIVEQFELHLHPIRLQLEHRVGRQILDYIFSQRRSKPVDEEDDSTGSDTPPAKPSRQSLSHLTPNRTASRSVESLAISKTPNRSGQSSSAASINGDHRLRRTTSKEVLAPPGLEEGLDANEMRLRAALNRTFILVDFTSTVLCLTYRVSSFGPFRPLAIANASLSVREGRSQPTTRHLQHHVQDAEHPVPKQDVVVPGSPRRAQARCVFPILSGFLADHSPQISSSPFGRRKELSSVNSSKRPTDVSPFTTHEAPPRPPSPPVSSPTCTSRLAPRPLATSTFALPQALFVSPSSSPPVLRAQARGRASGTAQRRRTDSLLSTFPFLVCTLRLRMSPSPCRQRRPAGARRRQRRATAALPRFVLRAFVASNSG